MRRIAIVQGAHLGSERIPLKLLEDLGGKRLIQIGLELMLKVGQATDAVPIVVYPEGDDEIYRTCASMNVEAVPLSPRSTMPNAVYPVTREFVGRFDWVFLSNFLLRPFLQVETAVKCVRMCRIALLPFVTAKAKRGAVWEPATVENRYSPCVIGKGKTADTKNNPLYMEFAHLGYGMPSTLLLDDAALGRLAQPWCLKLANEEMIDIDTQDDLEFARAYLVGRNSA